MSITPEQAPKAKRKQKTAPSIQIFDETTVQTEEVAVADPQMLAWYTTFCNRSGPTEDAVQLQVKLGGVHAAEELVVGLRSIKRVYLNNTPDSEYMRAEIERLDGLIRLFENEIKVHIAKNQP